MKVYVFSAAGGNPTAIVVGNINKNRYKEINNYLLNNNPFIEQVGFYNISLKTPRLQMAGGEFCGNAARSMACLLKIVDGDNNNLLSFNTSGFDKKIVATVIAKSKNTFYCEMLINSMQYKILKKKINGIEYNIVDLGGIVHILVNNSDIKFNKETCKIEMKNIIKSIGIDREAIGVVWYEESINNIKINPVVWVRDVDTCYYETSCGSGTIAIGLFNCDIGKEYEIFQPSNKSIKFKNRDNNIYLSSAMKLEKIINLNI